MQKTDYKDLKQTPEAVASATKALAANATHLARLLQASQYPAV
ncbi:MAG: NADPH-dependent oxidoreductase [Candidatus Saccharibacteria bacterium]|nr:NADPH-dependent oxidoreductase [Candidatus Saccharibacteria bacterium]